MGVIEQIKLKKPLLGYLHDKVELKSRGNSYWGKCPFHDDSTASFQVWYSHKKQEDLWTCQAGCGSGDLINFYCKWWGLPMGEAIHRLCEELGLERGKQEKLSDFDKRKQKAQRWCVGDTFRFALAIENPELGEIIHSSPSSNPIEIYLEAFSLLPTKTNKEKALAQLETYAEELKTKQPLNTM